MAKNAAYARQRKAVMALLEFSNVYYKLEPKSKARYHEKIAMIRNEDPYALNKSEFSKDVSLLPSLKSVCVQ